MNTYATASREATRRLLTHLAASFPVWRFPAMRAGGVSLFEGFGLTRLTRPTDVRDPSLPPSNPQRDEFGVGFTATLADGGVIEFRRAYLAVHLVAPTPVTVWVRNNASYFGRDRLPAPVLVRQGPLATADLLAMTPAQATDPTWAHAWDPEDVDHPVQAAIETAVRTLAIWDDSFARWLATPNAGLPLLGRYLEALAQAGRSLPYLTRQPALHEVTASLLPDAAVRVALAQGGQGHPALQRLLALPGRLVLASGPEGDAGALR